jgi:hypothetical protein
VQSADTNAVYLFCFVRPDRPLSIDETGVDGTNPIFFHTLDNISAVLSMVSLEDFVGPSAEARMQDLEWIGPRAFKHQKVIELVNDQTAVFPARFGTLFHSVENLENLMRQNHEVISEFLNRVSKKSEWSVKAFLDQPKASEEMIARALAEQERNSEQSAGMRYMQEKRIKSGIEKEVNRWLEETCRSIGEDLSVHASSFTERNILPKGATEAEGEMILNWAFLVPKESESKFLEKIEQANAQYSSRGLEIHCSGPWPPYSFTPVLKTELGG